MYEITIKLHKYKVNCTLVIWTMHSGISQLEVGGGRDSAGDANGSLTDFLVVGKAYWDQDCMETSFVLEMQHFLGYHIKIN